MCGGVCVRGCLFVWMYFGGNCWLWEGAKLIINHEILVIN